MHYKSRRVCIKAKIEQYFYAGLEVIVLLRTFSEGLNILFLAQMQKSIRKPKNWQDFETLCTKLWSEELKTRLKQNGRNGQQQKGVDIYGIPKNSDEYWGIQCKLKAESLVVTNEEIGAEITNAENFKPKLEQFIFATTAPKDAKLEEWVRCTNQERLKNGKFGIELYCWEDIEILLGQNAQTHGWYMRNLDVQRSHAVEVCFEDGTQKMTIKPKFLQVCEIRVLKQKSNIDLNNEHIRAAGESAMSDMTKMMNMMSVAPFGQNNEVNHSWCDIEVTINNCGSAVIKNWRLRFYLDEKDASFYDPSNKGLYIPHQRPWKFEWEQQVLYRDPDFRPFVQKQFDSVSMSVKPNPGVKSFNIEWELTAEDYYEDGLLKVEVQPEIIEETKKIEVKLEKDVSTNLLPLRDYCST